MCHSAKPQYINLNKHWSLGKVIPTLSTTYKGLITVHYTGEENLAYLLFWKKNSQNLLEMKNKNIGLPYPFEFLLSGLTLFINLD